MSKVCKFMMGVVFVITVLCVTAIPSFALTEGDWEFQLLDSEVMITGYLGTGGDVVMPETIYGCPVTSIDTSTFSDTKCKLVSLKMSENIKEIPDNFLRFTDSDNLKCIDLPNGLISIGSGSFIGCKALTEVVLPPTLEEIGRNAFEGCTSLKKINFPASLKKVVYYGVFSDTALEEVDMGQCENLSELPTSMFYRCKLLRKVILPPNIKEITWSCFEECESLSEITIPYGIEKIGRDAFKKCKSLKEIIIPTTVKRIGESAFSDTSLTEVVIPYGVEEIAWSFKNIQTLKSLYVPDSVLFMYGDTIDNSPNCIIYCTANSKAAEVCKENKISYLTDNSVNSGITVLYNGTRVSFHRYDQNPELINSRTLVPLRSIFEAMNATVEWEEATQTAIAKRDGIEVRITIGKSEMYKDGSPIAMDVPAQLLNDRTMVPVRVIAEAFGATVDWNDAGKTVLISE